MNNNVIAILASTFLYGKERANLKVYSILKEAGYNIKLIKNVLANDKLNNAIDNLGFESIVCTFPEYKFGPVKRYIQRFKLSIVVFHTFLKHKPKVILLCDSHVAFSLAFLLRVLPSKVVYRAGDDLSFDNKERKKGLYKLFWEYIVSPSIDTLVCNSKYVRSTFNSVRHKNSFDKIIHNFPPHRITSSCNEELKYKIKKHISFGFIGRIDESKGCHHYVEAAIRLLKEWPETIFYIAGEFKNDDYANILYQKIQQQKEKIITLGEIENIELFYKHIDVVCVPSIYEEPMANILIESKFHATPCIIYPSGGMPEVVEHLKDGFICREKHADYLYKAFKYYIASPAQITLHGQKAKESIEENDMTFEKFKKNWLSVFNKYKQW